MLCIVQQTSLQMLLSDWWLTPRLCDFLWLLSCRTSFGLFCSCCIMGIRSGLSAWNRTWSGLLPQCPWRSLRHQLQNICRWALGSRDDSVWWWDFPSTVLSRFIIQCLLQSHPNLHMEFCWHLLRSHQPAVIVPCVYRACSADLYSGRWSLYIKHYSSLRHTTTSTEMQSSCQIALQNLS